MLLEILLSAISPTLLIPKPEWQRVWRQNEFGLFKRPGRVLCLGFLILYFSHFFLVDLPVGKQPIGWWAFYRFSVSGVALLAFLASFTKWYSESRFYKLPVFLCVVYTVHMQGESMYWRSDIPFFYVPLFAMFGAYALRVSVFTSLLIFTAILFGALPSFHYHPEQTHHMVSASLVAAIVLVVLRSRLKKDLETFILQQKHESAQKELIENQLAMMEQLRAFLPRVLFRRVDSLIRDQRKTPFQAVAEVTKPRKALAAVFFSDIRGFTGLSKTGDDVILNSILPSQKACTDTIEDFGGVPRIQGDLIFAYFDDEDPIVTFTNAIRAAAAVYSVNSEINSKVVEKESEIKRFATLSFGEAIVGNIGGTEGAMEITVIGSVANLPARIDVLTKEPKLKAQLKQPPIIVTTEAADFLSVLYPNLKLVQCDLQTIGLVIRDYPEETSIYFLFTSEENLKALELSPNESAGRIYLEKRYSSGSVLLNSEFGNGEAA